MTFLRHFVQPTLGFISRIPALEKIHERLLPLKTIQLPENKELKFFCPNDLIKYRLDTFFSKEPQTLAWLDSLPKDDVVFDIGANIGLYTLYGGITNKRIIAFEPDSLNYSILNRNIFINSLSEKITAYNIALSDENSLSKLYLSKFIMGASLHQVDVKLQKKADFTQGIALFTLDDVCKLLKITPNHIKIDVDGHERNILKGAPKTLSSEQLKTLLIEVDETQADKDELLTLIAEAGLKLKEKHSLNAEKTFFNYVFHRP